MSPRPISDRLGKSWSMSAQPACTHVSLRLGLIVAFARAQTDARASDLDPPSVNLLDPPSSSLARTYGSRHGHKLFNASGFGAKACPPVEATDG